MGVKLLILAEKLLVFELKILENLNIAINKYIEQQKPIFLSPRGGIELYGFRAHEAMPLMEEVGRLRELSFRAAGGGTGCDVDIDSHDLARDGYCQLIAWDSRLKRIVGGYRYILGREDSAEHISTLKYFRPSELFRTEIMPHAIELGRSFVSIEGGRSLFAMDALWRGLAQIVQRLGWVRYLFGKVTVYPQFDEYSHNLIRLFLHRFHPAQQEWLQAVEPIGAPTLDDPFVGVDYEKNYALLMDLLKLRGEHIPPMLHAYMRLERGMQSFDTILNHDFGNTYETAILLSVGGVNRKWF